MVLFLNCNPTILNAYSTAPLTPAVATSVQHAFYDGSFARFGHPVVRMAIHDRPDFHHLSHLQIRTRLDSEAITSAFLLIDDNTAATNGLWYVETTEICHLDTDGAIKAGHPPVTYPDEDFTLWQMYLQAADVPTTWATFNSAVSSITERLINSGYWPYDPHNPQLPPASTGTNWSDPETTAGYWGPAYIKANFSDIEWTAREELRRKWSPMPPAVVRLTMDAARDNGLLQDWVPAHEAVKVDEETWMSAPYDLESPRWPGGYPDAATPSGFQVLTPESESSGLRKTTDLGLCDTLRSRLPWLGRPQIMLPDSKAYVNTTQWKLS